MHSHDMNIEDIDAPDGPHVGPMNLAIRDVEIHVSKIYDMDSAELVTIVIRMDLNRDITS